MLPRDRFILFGDIADHSYDMNIVRLVNESSGLGLRFENPDYRDWPDNEPGYGLSEKSLAGIAGKHALFFSCPIRYELEAQLEFMTAAFKRQYGVASTTVVMRFLRFRRQDHNDIPYEVECLRLFLRKLAVHCGVDRLIVLEPHNIARTQECCDEFGLKLYACDPTRLFADAIRGFVETERRDNIRIYAPDFGSVGRALALARETGTAVVATPKERLTGDTIDAKDSFAENDFLERIRVAYGDAVSVSCSLADIREKHVIMREDELETGGTSCTTAFMMRRAGAKSVHLAVTHPVCTSGWKDKLVPRRNPKPFDNIWFGDARPRGDGIGDYKERTGGKITTVNLAPCLAETLIKVLEEIT